MASFRVIQYCLWRTGSSTGFLGNAVYRVETNDVDGGVLDEFGADAFDVLVEPELADFVSQSFEDLCCSALNALYPNDTITQIGQWWYGEHEIDVVGLTTEKTVIAGECKFQQSPLGYDALSNLERHVDELHWTPNDGGNRIEEYALFSRSGFKQSVTEAAEARDNLTLFTVEDVVTAFGSKTK